MDERNWKSLHLEIRLLSRFLSFSMLTVVWLLLGAVKYRVYGVAGWDMAWNIKHPSIWNVLVFYWQNHVSPYVFWIIVGVVADYFCWPYFLRKENGLKFEYGE